MPPTIQSISPAPGGLYFLSRSEDETPHRVVGLVLVAHADGEQSVEPLYLAGGRVQIRTPETCGEVLTRDEVKQRQEARKPPPAPEPTRDERNRATTLDVLRKHPGGVAKGDLMAMLYGRQAVRREGLSSLLLEGVAVEYRDGKRSFVMLNPKVVDPA